MTVTARDLERMDVMPLSAAAPLYRFTYITKTSLAFEGSAVFLFDYHGQPHWFASDGLNAILTPALPPAEGQDNLFEVRVGRQFTYSPRYIKELFTYSKQGRVYLDRRTGTLYSANAIMQVPAFQRQRDDGALDDDVPMPDMGEVFRGERVPVEQVSLGVRFVSAIRGAFSHLVRDAELTLSCLEGERLSIEVEQPYSARMIVFFGDEGGVRESESDDSAQRFTPTEAQLDAVERLAEHAGEKDGVITEIFISDGQGNKVTLDGSTKGKLAQARKKLRRTTASEASP